jgi:ketosteroid isomerase-like protein
MNCLRVLRMERDSPRGILHAMSQAKVEIVRRAFAAFDSGRLERVRDLVTDDLIVYRAEPDAATVHGLDGFLELTAEWTEGFEDWAPIPEEFKDLGDKVVMRVRQVAQGKASGVPIADNFWFVYEFRGARISKMSIYAHEAEALEAAGVRD